MQFSPDYLRQVLPPGDPPPALVPEQVRLAIQSQLFSAGQKDPELIDRCARWTYAIFSEIDQGFAVPFSVDLPPWLAAPGWRLLSPAVGVLDPSYEAHAFGLVIQLSLVKSMVLGEVRFPRLGPSASFPLALRAVTEDLHAVPTLANASSCCWAEDNSTRGLWGFLTCRHAVNGIPTGAKVSLQGGGTGQVQRKAPPSVDAAFVSTTAPSATVAALPVTRWATAGQSVDVVVASGAVRRSVVDVTNTLGVVADHNCPINVYIDQPCQPGDSGSLVVLPSGRGLGIYRGSLSGATIAGVIGQTVGFAQHLEQAVLVLNVAPHL